MSDPIESARTNPRHSEVANLYGRYAFALDSGNVSEYTATFTTDGAIWPNEGPFQQSRGRFERDEFAGLLVGRDESTPRHIVFNVTVLDDQESSMALAGLFDVVQGGFMALLRYDDLLKAENGRWLFFEKRVTFLWQSDRYLERAKRVAKGNNR